MFAQEVGGDTLFHHNGAQGGSVALMYSTRDGSKTLTAGLNCVDDAELSLAAAFQNAQQRLVNEVFCGGRADPAQPTDWTPSPRTLRGAPPSGRACIRGTRTGGHTGPGELGAARPHARP
ncbi:hypothetical protein JCM4914_73290 [Streptomyces platensis subsp. malvinus]